MDRLKNWSLPVLFVFIAAVFLSGCTIIFQKGRRSDLEKISELSSQLDELNSAKELLAQRLKQEIDDQQVRLEMAEKGLVITFVADVLFDSGKDKIKAESFATLDKVARVLNENLPEFNIGIEGHTDTEPIKHSGWKSNWELSAARALSVLHYIVDDKGVSAGRVSAVGYGEHKPVAENDTKEGMKLNRRVEIVVLPKTTKIKPETVLPAAQESVPVQEAASMEPKVDLKKYK